MRKAPTDGATRFENCQTQPLKKHRVFNNPDIITEGWYPVCPSSKLNPGQADSVKLTYQRILIYRSEGGEVVAMDAFCPHMGADLANGRVVGDRIECYFHQWQFEPDGTLADSRCARAPKNVKNHSWPAEEKYGYIWVYSAQEAPYPVPSPPGLEEEEIESWNIANVRLLAHHHVMIVGGVDLLHFATVHNLDVDFDLEAEESALRATWKLDGVVSRRGWREAIAHRFIGGRVNYHAHVAGGSYVSLAYGPDLQWARSQKKTPVFYIAWGCVPTENGVSDVKVFAVTKKAKGFFGWLKTRLKLLLTVILLAILQDDDVKAFPYMRFNIGALAKEDRSASRMVRFLNSLPVSVWSRQTAQVEKVNSLQDKTDSDQAPTR
jgi:nitrite reductase/ring-hydroxylating ferredoxin subunit